MMKLALYALVLSATYAVVAVLDHEAAQALTIAFVAAILIPGLYDARCMHRDRTRR